MQRFLFLLCCLLACVIKVNATPVMESMEQKIVMDELSNNKMDVGLGLKVGVAVVAPSGFAQQSGRCEKGIEVLRQRGFAVKNYYDANAHDQRFAAADDVRLEQLKKAYEDPDSKIIMAIRGGYGASRLLNHLDFRQMAKTGKVFVGYSDITVIQMGLLKYGAVSFAGPMVCSDYGIDDPSAFTLDSFEKTISKKSVKIQWQGKGNPTTDVSGVFWGGNLTMISHLVGTKWLPDIKDGILFVEDISEHPFRVERMLIQLDEAGILCQQKALVLGDFTGYRLSDVDNGYDFEAMLSWIRKRVSIPVITGLPFGHVKDKVTLPVGAKAHLHSAKDGVTLELSGYPTVK